MTAKYKRNFAKRKALIQRRAQGQEAWKAREAILADAGGRRGAQGEIACAVCGGKLYYHVRPCGRVFARCKKGCVEVSG